MGMTMTESQISRQEPQTATAVRTPQTKNGEEEKILDCKLPSSFARRRLSAWRIFSPRLNPKLFCRLPLPVPPLSLVLRGCDFSRLTSASRTNERRKVPLLFPLDPPSLTGDENNDDFCSFLR